jgi:hypothetical protein
MNPFNMNPSEFSKDVFDDEFSKDTLRIGKLFVNSKRELKKVKQEKVFNHSVN